MKIHEYQAKDILRAHGVVVPEGRVAFSEEEARTIAKELGTMPVVVKAQIHAGALKSAISAHSGAIQTLARVNPVTFLDTGEEVRRDKNALVLVRKDAEVVIPMASMVDLEEERARLDNEIEQIQAEVAQLESRLSNQAFLSKAPPAVIEKERTRLAERRDRLERLKQQLATLQA